MGRYSKSYSNFILRKKHQNINEGFLFERDWVTIGNVHRLEPGKKPYFGDAGFIFTDNSIPFFKKKHDYGKWVAHFVYDDVKDASNQVNEVVVNTDSDDLRSYAYYGSMADLVRTCVEDIVTYFPGLLRLKDTTLQISGIDGSLVDTGFYEIENNFGLDLHTATSSLVDFDNILKYLTASYSSYEVTSFDSNEEVTVSSPVVSYEVMSLIEEILKSPKYHDKGYDFLYYKGILYKWNDSAQEFEEVKYSNDCANYFVKCDEYIRYGDEYYEWSDEYGHYVPLTNVYELCDDDNQNLFKITIGTEDENRYTIRMYIVNGTEVYCFDEAQSTASFLTIQPNGNVIENYFKSLTGFERKLLTRKSKPLYTNTFKVPYKLPSEAYVMVDRVFTWPSFGYCIDVVSPAFVSFVNSLMNAGELYDELYSDCIWRCMTHESIKNFDWTYRRVYSDTDEQDNIDGGNRMMEFLRFYGRIYDEAKMYIEGIKSTNNVSYDGMLNVPDAELSDKNTVHGWDIVSTVWEPYYYVEIELEDIPEDAEVIPFPYLPVDVNSESPEYISVRCYEEESNDILYYHREYNDPSLLFLTDEFLNNEDYIIGKYDSWITHNHNMGYWNIGCETPEDAEDPPVPMASVPPTATENDPEYIEVDGSYYRKGYLVYNELSGDPMYGLTAYWNESNTLDALPKLITSYSPQYIRLYKNGFYRYYALSDNGFNNKFYTHSLWFDARNTNTTTPVTTDIEFQRRLFLSNNRIFKTKGTRVAIDMVMGMFGLGSDGETPDYTITEHYRVTQPKKGDDIFYFYEEVLSTPQTAVLVPSLEEAIAEIGEDSPEYIRVVNNGVTHLYQKNSEYTYDEMIVELSRHKLSDRLYNDEYSGVPLNSTVIGNDKYIIPYHTNRKVYDGYLYYQQKGGWGKWSDDMSFTYDYSETIPYLHMMPNISSLLSVVSLDLRKDDVYYVFDTTDYVDYDEDVPYDLSHFFKIADIYNPQFFGSWKNIPMEGNIVYDTGYNENGVTHDDYIHAKYLNSIIPSILYNNPHTGNGEYDGGEDFFLYMQQPYKYEFETYNFDDEKYVEISKQLSFSLERISSLECSDKVSNILDTYHYEIENDVLVRKDEPAETEDYYLNDKFIILRNENNNIFHNKFMKDVVLKYVLQVIPSTTILVLENFNTMPDSEVIKHHIRTVPWMPDYGTTSGDGDYVETTYATIRATEKEGYHFVEWIKEEGQGTVSTDPVARVRVCGPQAYIAVFQKDCTIEASCETVCNMSISCESEEPCSVTLLCETEEQKCDISIDNCETTPSQDMAVVEFILKVNGASSAEEAAEVLQNVCIFDNTCDGYDMAMSNSNHRISFDPSTKECMVTLFPTTEDNIRISSPYLTVPRKKSYNVGEVVSFCWATVGATSFSGWSVESQGSTQSYSSDSITVNMQTGTTKITAIFNKM